MNITVSSKAFSDHIVDCYGFIVLQDDLQHKELRACAKKMNISLDSYIAYADFTGKKQEIVTIPHHDNGAIKHIIIVGIGTKKDATLEGYRRALALLYRTMVAQRCTSAAVHIPTSSLFDCTPEHLGQESAATLLMAEYNYDEFVSKDETKKQKPELKNIIFYSSSKEEASFKQGIEYGEIIGSAVNKTRYWVNTPPSHLTPIDLADKAEAIAKKYNLAFTKFAEPQINKMGMGGLAAVGRGSDNDCQLVIMEYKTKKKSAPTIAFVGKGITFDSGGLSLKPAVSMETMKEDMSGAAAVITTMEALAQIKPDINVIGVAPLAENLPSGKATKPGDIVRFYNGKTAEIKNTDAEGRLILADALSYVVKHYKPDAIIDIATLTGACAYALGPFHSGLMGVHDDLIERIKKSAQHSGDHVWQLPLSDDYAAAIKSDVSDMCNIGNNKYMAGAITAAHFLKNFVGDTPWAHLDIAGTSFNVPDKPYYRTGATGVGVRLLVDIARNWK